MPDNDPFSLVHQRLWEILEAHRGFASLVKLGNRRRVFMPPRQAPPADLPQVEIRPGTCRVKLFATTTGSVIEQDLVIGIHTGQAQPQQSLYPLRWQIIRAVASAGDTMGVPFVEKVRLGDERPTQAEPGWAAVLTLTVVMRFDNRRDLHSEEIPAWI